MKLRMEYPEMVACVAAIVYAAQNNVNMPSPAREEEAMRVARILVDIAKNTNQTVEEMD